MQLFSVEGDIRVSWSKFKISRISHSCRLALLPNVFWPFHNYIRVNTSHQKVSCWQFDVQRIQFQTLQCKEYPVRALASLKGRRKSKGRSGFCKRNAGGQSASILARNRVPTEDLCPWFWCGSSPQSTSDTQSCTIVTRGRRRQRKLSSAPSFTLALSVRLSQVRSPDRGFPVEQKTLCSTDTNIVT